MRIINTSCCVFISTILRILMSFQKFYMRNTTNYSNDLRIDSPKDYANAIVIEGFESRRICGLSNRAEIVNPDDYDIDKDLCVLRKYRNISL